VKKGKKVTLTGRLTEIVRQACQSGQAVELQRKRPSQTAVTTVEQLTTDAAGRFSTKKKVKKTFDYRAQVAETRAAGPGSLTPRRSRSRRSRSAYSRSPAASRAASGSL
jgi:hypothetical protein